MKSSLRLLSAVALTVVVSGCASTSMNSRAGFAAVAMHTEAGLATSDGGNKTGTACTQNYVGVVTMGDSSIEAAKKAGGISRVSSVDYEYFTILGFYGKVCTIVKGS